MIRWESYSPTNCSLHCRPLLSPFPNWEIDTVFFFLPLFFSFKKKISVRDFFSFLKKMETNWWLSWVVTWTDKSHKTKHIRKKIIIIIIKEKLHTETIAWKHVVLASWWPKVLVPVCQYLKNNILLIFISRYMIRQHVLIRDFFLPASFPFLPRFAV